MAEAFLRELAGDEFEIVSAGAEAGRLDPLAVAAMREAGIDISSAQTKWLICTCASDFTMSLRCAIGIRSGRARYSRAQSGGSTGL